MKKLGVFYFDKKTNVIYFDPHKLQMTDHICYLNLVTTILSRHLTNNLEALKNTKQK